ncbi:NADH:flavin oxidoreductase [Croceicoccus bisphenolivorans]|uniref:oxidoreductase n=1 Tax=Croceicoccus bisphenolivorans TaxID=1783232 RepID=UPI000831D17D|nr:NADH:flavin oxidoreductase [Croceicoccus bisphenolivorans]
MANTLMEPAKLGSLTLKNRIIMSPMAVLSPEATGRPSPQTAAFLAARARGGVGMIITGGTVTSQRAFDETPYKGVMRADVEYFAHDLAAVAAAVHEHDVPIVGQIMPGFGRMGIATSTRHIISASPIRVEIPQGEVMPFPQIRPTPRAATLDEIHEVEAGMIASAVRLHRAGWDGIEVAAHMSYFLASFLSPRTNTRSDAYGGSVANRARIVVNIVRGIREELGRDFVIGLRTNSNELVPGGQGAEGFAEIVREVEPAGLDYFAPTPGGYEAINETTDARRVMIHNGDMAVFRKALSVPLVLMGLHREEDADAAMVRGHGDFVMLARPLLADPALASKLQADRRDDIVRCGLDGYCGRRLMMGMPVRCKLNPQMGREHAVANGAPLSDRSLRRRMEDGLIALSQTRPAIALARYAMAIQNRKNRAL